MSDETDLRLPPWDAPCECTHPISEHAPGGGRCRKGDCLCPIWRGVSRLITVKETGFTVGPTEPAEHEIRPLQVRDLGAEDFAPPDVSQWVSTAGPRNRTASALAARAHHAGVPTDPRVLPFVLREDIEKTHAVVLAHEIVGAFEKDAIDNGIPMARLTCFSADAGPGKTIGLCHAAVRSFLSFVYVCAVDLEQVAPWSPEWVRLVGADILVIDDVEQAIGNARVMEKQKILVRKRYGRGSLTLPAGNFLMPQADADAGGFLDRAMNSRLFEQEEKYKMKWFERIKGRSFRHA